MSCLRLYLETIEVKKPLVIKDREVIYKFRNVLRVKPKREVYLFNGKGKEYLAKVVSLNKESLVLEEPVMVRQEDLDFPQIILAFPLLKEEKVDIILQKTTELGVAGFVPFLCERSISSTPSLLRQERWQRIIIEASRQSNRLWVPFLEKVCRFKDLLNRGYPLKLCASLKGQRMDFPLNRYKEILVLCGPEGDFSAEEYRLLEKSNFRFFLLSRNILRVETAAIFAVGLINYLRQ